MHRTREQTVGRLRHIELFAELDEAELGWLAEVGEPVALVDGEVLFEDGQPAEYFYVLLDGELLISKIVDGGPEVLARQSAEAARAGAGVAEPEEPPDRSVAAHQFAGELPMLAGGGYVARGTAIGPTELLAYDQETFLELIVRCPRVCRVLLPVLAWRIRSYELQASRRALLDSLGTLSAGLAHELNNPSAAAVRAANGLRESMTELASSTARWGRDATAMEDSWLTDLITCVRTRAGTRDPFEVIESLDAMACILARHGLTDADELAAVLTDNGVEPGDVAELACRVRECVLPAAITTLAHLLRADALVVDVTGACGRIAMLVRDTKAYTNLGRAPERAVDLVEGIEATLTLHAAKLDGIAVCRDYAPDLPQVRACPGELNQVWANLIDNAADAMDGCGVLRISTRRENHYAVVEVRDDGPGIPPGDIDMLFQPFFTTKDIGKGTGLGLHQCHGIVTIRHRGTIGVTSVPGDTRFTVRLPIN